MYDFISPTGKPRSDRIANKGTTLDRRVLIVASQCSQYPHLTFLPAAAHDLYEVLCAPELGECVPALSSGGLLLDPSALDLRAAVREAFLTAAGAGAMLVLVFIGHGAHADNDADHDFFFQPYDAPAVPTSDTSFHIVQFIKDLHRSAPTPGVDGLLVLIDTCGSGVGAVAAASKWTSLAPYALRYEVLTAAADRPAVDGCFTRQLVAILREGLESQDEPFIRCEAARELLLHRCPHQRPQLPSFNSDAGLFIARNRRYRGGPDPSLGAAAWSEIDRLTQHLQPTKRIAEVVEVLHRERCVVVVGNAGTGKSTIAAALLRPDRSNGMVPTNFVQAVAFITESTSPEDLAKQLSTQLSTRSASFASARQQVQHDSAATHHEAVDRLEWEVVLPLRQRTGSEPLRIVIDGLDQLAEIAGTQVRNFIDMLTSDAEIVNVHLLITSRPDGWIPSGCKLLAMRDAEPADLILYFRRRGTELDGQRMIDVAGGNWLIASLHADMSLAGAGNAPTDPMNLFAELLRRAGVRSANYWNSTLKPILAPLAISGAGPTVPLPVLCAASSRLGGPSSKPEIRNALVSVRGLVVRSLAGTESEMVGLFHGQFGEFLLADENITFHIDRATAIEALLDGISHVAPMAEHSATDPVHLWAATVEPTLKWDMGDVRGAITVLKARPSLSPVDNLRRWEAWLPRVLALFPPENDVTFRVRGEIAFWTGKTGNVLTALELQKALLDEQEQVLGTKHTETLLTRAGIAHFTGKAGRIVEAVAAYREVLKALSGKLDRDDLSLLRIRGELAYWTAESGDTPGAQILYSELVEDYTRVVGSDAQESFEVKAALADVIGENGDSKEAYDSFRKFAGECSRLFGESSYQALIFERHSAHWAAKCGDVRTALRQLRGLLPKMEEVLGPSHRETLLTRSAFARWTKYRDKQAALRLYRDLLRDQEKHLGPHHPDTVATRHNLAEVEGEVHGPNHVITVLRGVLADSKRALGLTHPRTIAIRGSIAHWTGKRGNSEKAVSQYLGILDDQTRYMGPEHPECLRTRVNIGRWLTYKHPCKAVEYFESLIVDQKKGIGAFHPAVFETRAMKANALAHCGNIKKALQQLKGLVSEQSSLVGDDHPSVHRTLRHLKHWSLPSQRRKKRHRGRR